MAINKSSKNTAKKSGKKSKTGFLSTSATIADNRRARYEYTLEDKFEAGIQLTGTEVKSLRLGQCSIHESYVGAKGMDMMIYNMHIPEYQQASQHLQHDPKRPRRLLLHKREINRLLGAVNRQGYTIIPTHIYFNAKGLVKLGIALAKGKQLHDKRETIKKRDWSRQKQRIMKEQS